MNGKRSGIMTEYNLIEVSEEPYLYTDCECAMDPAAISKTMGKAFTDVMAFIQERHIALTGPGLSVYYTFDPDRISFRAGFFVAAEDAKKAEGPVLGGLTPAGRVLTFTHTGPYSALGQSYNAMMGYLEKEGLKLGAPTWEVYVDDPDSIPEESLRTEIFVSLA
jgi:effector-binding domain-containing protein